MRNLIFSTAGLALVFLTGCEQETLAPPPPPAERLMYAQGIVSDVAEFRADDGFVQSGQAEPGDPVPSAEQFIAYSYDYQLEFPPNTTEPAMQAHRDRCLAAGFEVCQVISSSSSAQSADMSYANLRIRAVPTWLDTFRAGLEGEADEVGGRVNSSTMSSADLTRSILDSDARLTAKRALRVRLIRLLERGNASIEELIQIERELARVQGEIESGDAQLRAMRARVSMSTIHLQYTTRHTATGGGAFEPVVEAVSNSVRYFSSGLGAVITFIALGAPWLILLMPLIWLLLRWRARVNARKQS